MSCEHYNIHYSHKGFEIYRPDGTKIGPKIEDVVNELNAISEAFVRFMEAVATGRQDVEEKRDGGALEALEDQIQDHMLKANGFDDAIIGIASRCGQPDALAYDANKIVEILIAQGMDEEEAEEYFGYNIEGAYMGEGTPIFLRLP